MTAQIQIIDCDTLDEFWEYVSPIGKLFGIKGTPFIYRGQGNSAWKLIPKIFRSEVLEKYKVGIKAALKDHPGQFFFEWSLLDNFLKVCDARGLTIPNDSPDFRDYFSQDRITNLHGINTVKWPEDRVIPLMALAQHHGMPTRLLDWTRNPYTACYFAAASSLELDYKSGDRIALFAFNQNAVSEVKEIRPVNVPGSTSVNLSAQAATFILIDNFGSRRDLFIKDVSLESKLEVAHRNYLKKITLPMSLAPDLLLRCERFGISAASLFPGYDGAARAVLEGTTAWDLQNSGG